METAFTRSMKTLSGTGKTGWEAEMENDPGSLRKRRRRGWTGKTKEKPDPGERTEKRRAGPAPARLLDLTDQQQKKPPPFPQPPQQQRSRMIQMQLLSKPHPQLPPHPQLFPHPLCPPQQQRRIRIQRMLLLLPHPHPQAVLLVSHPHPQFVAAKSLMF